MHMTTFRKSQRGALMMEVLIAMLIVAFGTLGFVGLQAQTTVRNIEGYQRSQALILLNDMAQRITLNRANASSYVATNIGTVNPGDCTTKTTVSDKDLCEWALLIQGSSETMGTAKLGAITGARGCITSPSANLYIISLAWQGVQATSPSPSLCGQNSYSAENMRRAATTVVRIATLSS